MIPIGGGLSNSASAFNRAADQFARSFIQQAESDGLARGVGEVETSTSSGTQLSNREEIDAPDGTRIESPERSESPDPATSAVELLASEQAVRANLAVIGVQDRTVGSLLDIFA